MCLDNTLNIHRPFKTNKKNVSIWTEELVFLCELFALSVSWHSFAKYCQTLEWIFQGKGGASAQSQHQDFVIQLWRIHTHRQWMFGDGVGGQDDGFMYLNPPCVKFVLKVSSNKQLRAMQMENPDTDLEALKKDGRNTPYWSETVTRLSVFYLPQILSYKFKNKKLRKFKL